MGLVASGPNFAVSVEGSSVSWEGRANGADTADARVFAAALLAAVEKAERIAAEIYSERERVAQEVGALASAPEQITPLNYRYWFTTGQAAEFTGMSSASIVKALQSGELKGSQRTPNARWRIHRDDIERWLGRDPNRESGYRDRRSRTRP